MDNRGEFENFGGVDSGQSLDASSSSDQREHWSSRQQQGNTVPGAPSTFLSSFRSALNSLSGLSQPRTTQEYDPSSMQIARQPHGYEEIGHGYDGMGHGYDGMGDGYGGLSQGYGGLSQGYGGLSQGYDELGEGNYGMGHGYDGMGQEYDGSVEGYYGTGNGYGEMSTYDPYGMSDIGLYGSSEFSMGSRGVLYGVSMIRTRYSGFGNSSRTVGFQMRMGHGVMGMSSLASMFGLGHGHTHSTGSSRSYCPIHGTSHGINSHDMEELFGTQSASSTNESDIYQGPIITELPDDEDDNHGVERSNISEPSITANTNVDNDHSFTSFNMKRQTVSNTAPAPEQKGKKNKNISMMKSKLGAAANKNYSVRKRSSPNNSPLPSLDLQTEIGKENDTKSNTVTDNNALHSSLDSQSQFQNGEPPNKVTATILEYAETENKTNDKDIIVDERKSLQTSIVFETNNKDVETKSKTDENKAIDMRFTENHQMREEINAKSSSTLNGNEAEVQDTTTYTDDPETRENTSFSNNNENDSRTNRLDTDTNSSTKHKVSLTFKINETADDNPSNYNVGTLQDESEAGSHIQPMFLEKVAKGEDRTSSSKTINAAMALRRELDETLTNLSTESIVNTEATKQDCISPEPEGDISSTQKNSCVSDSSGSSGHLDRMTSNFDKEVNLDEINKENTDLLSEKEKVEIIDHFPGTWLQSPEEFLSGGGDKEATQEVFPDLEMNSNLGECMSYSQLHTDLDQNTATRDSVYKNRTANEFVQSIEANGTEGVNVENKKENQVQFTLNDQSSLVYNGDHLEISQLEIKSDINDDDDDSLLSDDHLDECEFDQECVKSTKESYGNRNKSNQPEIRDKNRVLIGMSAEDRTNKEQLKRSAEQEHITKFSGTLGDKPKKKENTVAAKNVEDNSNPEKEYSSNVESIDKKSPSPSKRQSQKTRQKNATPKVYTKKELNLPTIDIRDELENNNDESTDNLQIKTEYMSNDNNTGDSAKKTVYFKSDQNIDDPAGKTVSMNEDYCKEVQWRYPGENIEKQNRKVPNDFKNNYEDLNQPPSSNANIFENRTTFSSQQCDGSSDGYKSEENQSGTSTSYAEPYHDSGLGDPLGHPDWQWLDEFTDDNHNFRSRKKSLKRNKNASVQVPSVDVDDKTVPKQSENMTSHQEGRVEGATASGSSTSAYPKTSNMYKTTSELSEMVAKEGLIVKDVYPDGNCLFAAVVDQLRVRGEFFYTVKTLREAAVKYLREHPCQPDGTPLSSFMSHYYCKTWDEYLDTMGQDGEWGDHIVISAIANVLKRRLVILGGVHTMHRTVMEPAHQYDGRDLSSLSNQNTSYSTTNKYTADLEMVAVVQTNENDATECDTLKPKDLVMEGNDATGRNASKPEESETFSSSSASLNAPKEHEPFDDLYLGHIAESHYLSLRHHDWEPRLHSCLQNKTGSCFLQYGASNAGNDRRADSNQDGSGQAETVTQECFPQLHLDFLLKFIQRANILSLPNTTAYDRQRELSKLTLIGDTVNMMEAQLPVASSTSSSSNIHQYSYKIKIRSLKTPNDTEVITSDYSSTCARGKDLIANDTGCSIGFTRLIPVDPSVWFHYAVKKEGEKMLRHIKLSITEQYCSIAFRCLWPKCADEWITRKRECNWPVRECLAMVKQNGVMVIPESHVMTSIDSDTEWKFSFDIAERLICKYLTLEARFCFHMLRLIVRFIFTEKSIVTSEHLKPVFFYTCEETQNDIFLNEPGQCILLMIRKLTKHLQGNFLPDYFIKDKNLLVNIESGELSCHLDRLRIFQDHIVEHMFLLFDQHGLVSSYGLGTCLDSLILDAQKHSHPSRVHLTYSSCFHPLFIFEIRERVKMADYQTALYLSNEAFTYLSLHMFQDAESMVNFMKDILVGLPLQDQWLFAFYLDGINGYNLLTFVCRNERCVSLTTIFGQRFVNALSSDENMTIQTLDIPTSVAFQRNLVKFALQFGILLKDFMLKDEAFVAAVHHFLKTNTHELLLTIEKDRVEGHSYGLLTLTLNHLDTMFCRVNETYIKLRQPGEFQDLIDLYDELCNFLDSAVKYKFIAELWRSFGNTQMALIAEMKANSLQPHLTDRKPHLPCSRDVPDCHLAFFMKYLLMSKHIYASFIKDTEFDKEVSTETVTTVMYHSMFDELGAFILHLDSNSAWTKCGKMIGQTDCQKDPTDINVYFYQEPKDTKVLTSNGVNAEAQLKDLLSDTEGCHFGYTTLVPVSPYIWMNTTEYVNGKPYLRHLKINMKNSKRVNSIIAFKCQLPKEAHEWLHRPRAHGWPSAELIGKIALDGCQVIPSRHQSCNLQSPPEWEFCFRNAERKLISEAVTNEQSECFQIGEVMMNYILKSSKIEYTHLRQVFFFTCEETTNSMWVEKPIMCVHLLIERLLNCCRSGYLPNYFISKNNMIAHVNKEDLRDCSEKIELVRKHLFIVLYFALDAHNQIQTVATVLDGVIEDIQRYGFHGNAVRSMNECFIPITVQGLAAYGQLKEYKLLLDQSRQAYYNLANLGERHASCLTLNELLLKVLQYISSKHLQWLCAFYLDQQLGTTFTGYVCENFPTVSIFHFFGRDIGTHLHTISGDIMIPSFLTRTEMLPKLACDFTLLLKEHLHMDGVVGEQILPYFFQHYKSSILQVVQNPDFDEFARTTCNMHMQILFNSLVAGTVQKLIQTVTADVNKQKLIVKEHLKNGRKAEAVSAMSKFMVFVQSVTNKNPKDIPEDWTKFCPK